MDTVLLLMKVKTNLIIDSTVDDVLLLDMISAAVDYAEKYQNMESGYYQTHEMPPCTERAVIMYVSHLYESRDGSTGGFFGDSVAAGDASVNACNALLRLDREWQV